MWSIYKKEVSSFFNSLIGFIVLGVFLVFLGLFMWVFPDTSILQYNFASLDQLFSTAPLVFVFLIPAITMRSFAEENQSGTIELLITKPVSEFKIVLGKYLAYSTLVLIALIPTLFYYYSVYQLGSPKGNLDSGAIVGSYIGLLFLGCSFVAIGLFASSLTKNQIVAFVLGTFLCFMFYWAFFFLSKLPIFVGTVDDIVQMIGIDHHYMAMSKGAIDTRNVIYFLTLIYFFIYLTQTSLESRKW